MDVTVGQPAPDFEAPNQDGETVRLADFKGRKLALFFYPEDDTPTCTDEACNLRDNYQSLLARGIQVVGVSPDSVKSHRKFADKFNLPYPILADPEHKLLDAYGVWGEKNMYGRKYMGTRRWTFIIDEQGVIEKIIKQVRSKIHADQLT